MSPEDADKVVKLAKAAAEIADEQEEAETSDEIDCAACSAIAELIHSAGALLYPWSEDITGKQVTIPVKARRSLVSIIVMCEEATRKALRSSR